MIGSSLKAVISRRGIAMGLVSVIAGTKATAVTAQRGRRDANAPSDSENTSASSVCVFMEEREGAFVLEGQGKTLTEPFPMDSGTYRIEVELVSGRSDFAIWIDFYNREDGEDVDFFTVSDSESLPEISSGIVEFPVDGEYLADVKLFSGDWKIVLSPI